MEKGAVAAVFSESDVRPAKALGIGGVVFECTEVGCNGMKQ